MFLSCGNKVNSQKHGQQPGIRAKSRELKLLSTSMDIPEICQSLYIQHFTTIFSSWTEYVSHSMSSGRDQLMSWHWKSLLCSLEIAAVVVDKGCSLPRGKRCSVYVNVVKAGEQGLRTSISACLVKGERGCTVSNRNQCFHDTSLSIPNNPNCCCGVIPFLSQQSCLCSSI